MRFNIKIVPKISTREELEELVEIDRHSYKSDPPRSAFEWVENFPWIYTLLKRETEEGWKTMGYGAVVPVNDFIMDGLRNGEVGEEDIGKKYVRFPSDADCFYLASIGTLPDISVYESSRLVGSVAGRLLRVTVPSIAVAITSSGEKVAREFGFESRTYRNSAFEGVGDYIPKLFEKEPFVF